VRHVRNEFGGILAANYVEGVTMLKRLNIQPFSNLSNQAQENLVAAQRKWSERTLLGCIIKRAKPYKRKPLAPVEYLHKKNKEHYWKLTSDTEYDKAGEVLTTQQLRKQGFKVPCLPKKSKK